MQPSCRRVLRARDRDFDGKQGIGEKILEPMPRRPPPPEAEQREPLYAVRLPRGPRRPRRCTVLQSLLEVAALDVQLGQPPRRRLGHRHLRRGRAVLLVRGQPGLQRAIGRVTVAEVVFVLVAAQQQRAALGRRRALERRRDGGHGATARPLEQRVRIRAVERAGLRGEIVRGVLEAAGLEQPARALAAAAVPARAQRRGQADRQRPIGRRLEERDGGLAAAGAQRPGRQVQQQARAKRLRQLTRATPEAVEAAVLALRPRDEIEISRDERIVGRQSRRALERLARARALGGVEPHDGQMPRGDGGVRRPRRRARERGLCLRQPPLLRQRVREIQGDVRGVWARAERLAAQPFGGVPYLMKDLTASIAGVPMTRSSRYYADAPAPTADSEHVRRLKRAGLVVFGRTNTCELGLSLTCEPQMHGATKNPWDPTRISGGSSGGAAAAVGARMLPMAHATDGFGSIRAPAACCGLVGLKPTRGRNTQAPYLGEGLGGLSAEHAVTLSVRDCAALLDATAGTGPGDPYVAPPLARPLASEVGADPGRLRIAFTSVTPNGAKVEAESLRTLAETAKLCADLGHHVEEVKPAIDGEAVVPTFLTLAAANTVVNLAGNTAKGRAAREDEVERVTWATGQMGQRVSGADYVRATQTAHRLGRQMAAFHQRWDILLTPGLATLPPKLGLIDMMLGDVDEYWRRVFHFSPFTVWFNLTGQPAMMLPLGVAGDLPVAVQLVARYGDEATLFRLAAQLETARPWFDRRPAIAR